MKQAFEFAGFLAAALAVHVVALPQDSGGVQATAGGDGAGSVVLIATQASLSDLAQAWETPPQVMTDAAMEAPMPPARAPAAPAPPARLQSPQAPAVPVLPLSPSAQDAAPQIDTTPAPPPVTDAAPTVSPRPENRPTERPATQPRATRATPRKAPTGGGQSRTAGTQNAAPQASAPHAAPATNPTALAHWGGAIRARIERGKRYPSGTRARGTVTMSISVNSNGGLASVSVARSSGDANLDRAGVSAVQRARLPAAPSGVVGGTHRFTLPMSFSP